MEANRIIKATDYDINSIVAYSIRQGIDITPREEMEWKMLLRAFKALRLEESSFVACSKLHGTPEEQSRKAWRYAKNVYFSQEQAATKVLYWASQANIKIWDFLPDEKQQEWIDRQRESEKQCNRYEPKRQDEILEEVKSILQSKRTHATPSPTLTTPNDKPKEYLSKSMLSQVENLMEQTTLYRFMFSEFGDGCKSIFVAYHVGGCKWEATEQGLATAFALMDKDSNLCDFQLSPFDDSGHGLRYPAPPGKDKGDKKINYALARMKRSADRPKWCMFGEHLLTNRPTDKVCIVEAPKTALIAALVYPQFVWLACLSLQWLNTAISCEPLRGREIILHPDRDGIKAWRDKARDLAKQGFNVSVSDFVERHPGEPNDDLADIVLRYRHGEQATPETEHTKSSPDQAEAVGVWNDFKSRNPYLQEIETTLDLEPIKLERHGPIE